MQVDDSNANAAKARQCGCFTVHAERFFVAALPSTVLALSCMVVPLSGMGPVQG